MLSWLAEALLWALVLNIYGLSALSWVRDKLRGRK